MRAHDKQELNEAKKATSRNEVKATCLHKRVQEKKAEAQSKAKAKAKAKAVPAPAAAGAPPPVPPVAPPAPPDPPVAPAVTAASAQRKTREENPSWFTTGQPSQADIDRCWDKVRRSRIRNAEREKNTYGDRATSARRF